MPARPTPRRPDARRVVAREFLLWCLAALLGVILPSSASAAGPVAEPAPSEDAGPCDGVESPRQLERLAEAALADGDEPLARACFAAMFDRQEFSRYFQYRPMLSEALILERLGQHEAAAAKYREGMENSALKTAEVLRIVSEHPDREALVQEVYERVRGMVAELEAGGSPVIYHTTKGAPRQLTAVTQREVLAAAAEGRALRYCYLESLDLSDPSIEIPSAILLNHCVIGRVLIPNRDLDKLALSGFVLGDLEVGKTWEGDVGRSKAIPASRLGDLVLRDLVVLGETNFADVTIRPGVEQGRALFPLVIFEGPADFKGAEFWGDTDFRFASFGAGANFKQVRLHKSVYFGGTRYREETVFTELFSERTVYFNSAVFEHSVRFDRCEWLKDATFEDSRFRDRTDFASTRLQGRLNLSRAVFHGPLTLNSMETGGLDALGAQMKDEALFSDSTFRDRIRFSLDEVTRTKHKDDPTPLLQLYRDYQGDEDADAPLVTTSSYGVTSVDDLTARIEGDISFANTVFWGYTVFEGVEFGLPEQPGVASFYNAQFKGETHFERSVWHAGADFTTIFGIELAFNEARFTDTLSLDDANVTGRITLTDASFEGDADWSWYGAEIATFQVYPEHVDRDDGRHRFFYERCALGDVDRADPRIQRLERHGPMTDDALRKICYDQVVDEFVGLKDSYGDRAMTASEDDAYWWVRHHETLALLRFGSFSEKLQALGRLFLFELCFGWGVRLGNLGICTLVISAIFAWIYRVFCPNTVIAYDGEDVRVQDISWVGLFFISFQSLLAINTGWDFGDDDHRFRYLNTIETLIGVIILTFFVGAYTRMILA